MYALLRAVAGVALRWYYRDIQVEGLYRVPRDRPLLVAVNHPNALVDALIVGWIMPRRVLITAKATLFANPIAGAALRWLGVVPLRRSSDEVPRAGGARIDPARNRQTFEAVHEALRRNGSVLIFPEGKTPDTPALAPLKTGAARMALYARDAGDVPGLTVVPIGLTFERRDAPRSRVLVTVGEPIVVDDWVPIDEGSDADALTAEIESRLRAVTLSYASDDDAARAVQLASLIAALHEDVPEIGKVDRRFGVESAIARRVTSLAPRLECAGNDIRERVDTLIRRLHLVDGIARGNGVLIEDVRIPLRTPSALRFTLREGWYLAVGGPVALWGRVNHWLPFRAARAIAMRNVESAADPAMRTIVAGAALVVLAYLVQTAVVAAVFGPIVAVVYLISLPVAADINFTLSERVQRAARRARAFVRFHRDPALQSRLASELDQLRVESLELEGVLTSSRTLAGQTAN